MAKKTDPLYVTWFKRNNKGRLEEVDIFGFIASQMNRTAYEWNTKGLGSVVFKKGTLKIIPLTDKTGGKGNNYETMWFELDLKVLKAAPGDLAAALQVLYKIVNDKSELLKLEKKAYLEMVRLLTVYLGEVGGLIMPSEYQSKPYTPGKKNKPPIKFSKSGGEYTSKWTQLINDIILKKDPKVVGGAVVSFSLADLLQVQIPSPRSTLKSIFMMEEFGTGLYADPELRRPYLGASTPFKVPQEVADQWGMPSAIYMWWPFFSFVQKAWLMRTNKLKTKKAQSAWIQKLKNTHGIKGSLNDYRKEAFASIKKYKDQGSLTSPLAWAYGAKRGGKVGHPGREARHLFFNRNGIVDEIRLIQAAGYRRLLQLIDEEIKNKVPGFNVSIADKVFGGLNY